MSKQPTAKILLTRYKAALKIADTASKARRYAQEAYNANRSDSALAGVLTACDSAMSAAEAAAAAAHIAYAAARHAEAPPISRVIIPSGFVARATTD